MPVVYIPALLKDLAEGKKEIRVSGSTVREAIADLERRHPGFADRLLDEGRLRGNLAVAIDGEISTLGLAERVEEDSEIHFIPAISGG